MSELKWSDRWIHPYEWREQSKYLISVNHIDRKTISNHVCAFDEAFAKVITMTDAKYKELVNDFYNKVFATLGGDSSKFKLAHRHIESSPEDIILSIHCLPSRDVQCSFSPPSP
jgi:hypothetical protein